MRNSQTWMPKLLTPALGADNRFMVVLCIMFLRYMAGHSEGFVLGAPFALFIPYHKSNRSDARTTICSADPGIDWNFMHITTPHEPLKHNIISPNTSQHHTALYQNTPSPIAPIPLCHHVTSSSIFRLTFVGSGAEPVVLLCVAC